MLTKLLKLTFEGMISKQQRIKLIFFNYLEVPDYILDYTTTLKHEDAEENL
jgi:hypothetical protein